MDQNTIIGILTGSLGTIVVKGLLDFFSKRIEHKRDLFKITYQRKLELAEKATAYYYTYFSKVQEIKKTLQLMLKAVNEETNLDIDLLNEMLGSSDKLLDKLVKSKFHEINSVHLYFNLDSVENWSETDLQSFYESVAEATYHSNEILELTKSLEDLDENSESDEEEYYSDKIKDKVPIYVESLEKLINSLEKSKNSTYQIIQNIKRQLKV